MAPENAENTNRIETDLAAFTLRLASQAQIEEHWKAEYVPWNRGRTYEDWVKVEAKGLRDRLSPSGVLQTWVLVRRDDYDGRIYSGVETYLRPGFSKAPSGDRVEDIILYGVASVVTPVDQHRRGFATHMLRLLHYCLGDPTLLPTFPVEWGAPPGVSPKDRVNVPYALASILLSDVGYKFYEKATIGKDLPGWKVEEEENHEIVWKCNEPMEKQRNWLYIDDLLRDDSLLLTLRDAALARVEQQGESAASYAYDPAAPWMSTHFVYRSLEQRAADWPYTFNTEPVGIRLKGAGKDGKDAIGLFTWSPALTGNKIDLANLANITADNIPDVLEAMDVLGKASGRELAWGFGKKGDEKDVLFKAVAMMPDRFVSTGMRAEVDGHLIGVAWYGDQGKRSELLDLDLLAWM